MLRSQHVVRRSYAPVSSTTRAVRGEVRPHACMPPNSVDFSDEEERDSAVGRCVPGRHVADVTHRLSCNRHDQLHFLQSSDGPGADLPRCLNVHSETKTRHERVRHRKRAHAPSTPPPDTRTRHATRAWSRSCRVSGAKHASLDDETRVSFSSVWRAHKRLVGPSCSSRPSGYRPRRAR